MPNINQQYITEFHPDIVKSVPALPAASSYTGYRFHRTSDHLDYYSDGTQWLSVTRYPLMLPYAPGIVFPASASATDVLRAGITKDTTYQFLLEEFSIVAKTLTTLTSTANWTIALKRMNSTGSTANIVTVSSWATARTAGTPYLNSTSIGAAVLSTDIYRLSVDLTKVSTPGNLDFDPATVWYRLIGL